MSEFEKDIKRIKKDYEKNNTLPEEGDTVIINDKKDDGRSSKQYVYENGEWRFDRLDAGVEEVPPPDATTTTTITKAAKQEQFNKKVYDFCSRLLKDTAENPDVVAYIEAFIKENKLAPKSEKKTRKSSSYNLFVSEKMKELKETRSDLTSKDRLAMAVSMWKKP